METLQHDPNGNLTHLDGQLPGTLGVLFGCFLRTSDSETLTTCDTLRPTSCQKRCQTAWCKSVGVALETSTPAKVQVHYGKFPKVIIMCCLQAVWIYSYRASTCTSTPILNLADGVSQTLEFQHLWQHEASCRLPLLQWPPRVLGPYAIAARSHTL